MSTVPGTSVGYGHRQFVTEHQRILCVTRTVSIPIFFFLRCRVVVDNVGDHVMPEQSCSGLTWLSWQDTTVVCRCLPSDFLSVFTPLGIFWLKCTSCHLASSARDPNGLLHPMCRGGPPPSDHTDFSQQKASGVDSAWPACVSLTGYSYSVAAPW